MRQRIERIACATDFSEESRAALSWATGLASETGAQVALLHVVDLALYAGHGEALLAPVDMTVMEREAVQRRLADFAGDLPMAWEPWVATGYPAEEIARMAAQRAVDLLVTATRGRRGFKRLLLGSVTARLLQTVHCPLLVVRTQAPHPLRLHRILVACDFSADANRALAYGLSLAQEFQAELHLVHVIEPALYVELSKSAADLASELLQELRQRLEAKLLDMVPVDARNWCTPHTALLSGRVDEELCTYAAAEQIELMVLGIRGQGLVEKLLIGSTTDRVVRRAQCPVLAVAAPSASSAI
jgi:nucleotide-binding universal stress UspA family protein